MCQHVKNGANDYAVREAALGAMHQFSGLTGATVECSDDLALAGAAWWWCKVYVKFLHHEFIIRERLGELGHLQGLISPEVLVRMKRPEGDCAVFSECVAAFLTVFGIPYEFVTVAVNPNEPEIFSHVYLYAVLPDGRRLPLDASHGEYPGWQVPSSHVSRIQVWDSDGNPVQDQGSRFDGLHNYGLRGMRGFGQVEGVDPSTGESYGPPVDTGSYVNPTQVFGPDLGYQGNWSTDTGTQYSGPTYQAPSQSNSAAWAAFANSLKGVLTLAEINAIQPGTVVGANGQILRQNPGYAVGTPTGALNLGSGFSTQTLVVGVLIVGAILFATSRGGR
jgi:hypothetical protein